MKIMVINGANLNLTGIREPDVYGSQTYADLEILLVDDGSPDRCGQSCDEYEKQDCRVRVFHTQNHGLSAARNVGLQNAEGEYIGFVDSDDWIEPEMYETLLRGLEETGSNVCICDFCQEPIAYEKEYYRIFSMKES